MIPPEEQESPKIQVPEPPTGLDTGFLSDYWKASQPLPRIGGIQVVIYFLRRGMHTIMSLPMSNAITVMTIAITLFLFAGFLLLIQNVDNVISRAGNSLNLSVYLANDADENAINEFIRELESNSAVSSVEFISKRRALAVLRAEFAANSGFLDGLEEDNPLPASLDVVLRPDELGINQIGQTVDKIRSLKIVDEVVYGSEWVERVQGVLKVFRLFGVVTMLVVLAIIVFLISNTIKLVIYSRRSEIEIMRLVGATEGFVRIPFVIGGIFQGLVGSCVGLLLLQGAFALLSVQLSDSSIFGIAFPELTFLSFTASLTVIVAGAIIGGVGSFFALGKLLDV